MNVDSVHYSRFWGYQLFPDNSLGLEVGTLFANCLDTDRERIDSSREEFNKNGVVIEEHDGQRALEEIKQMQKDLAEQTKGLRPFTSIVPQRPKNRSRLQEIITDLIEKNVDVSRNKKVKTICVFCRNNGETETVYKSHRLKDSDGKCRCPILRAHVCEICNATGDNAHTRKYCPVLNDNSGRDAAFNLWVPRFPANTLLSSFERH